MSAPIFLYGYRLPYSALLVAAVAGLLAGCQSCSEDSTDAEAPNTAEANTVELIVGTYELSDGTYALEFQPTYTDASQTVAASNIGGLLKSASASDFDVLMSKGKARLYLYSSTDTAAGVLQTSFEKQVLNRSRDGVSRVMWPILSEGYDAIYCASGGDEFDACVVRNGTNCGIAHRRTGQMLANATHRCLPTGARSWSPCDGQCFEFESGERFVFGSGLLKRLSAMPSRPLPAPMARPEEYEWRQFCQGESSSFVPLSRWAKALERPRWRRFATYLVRDADTFHCSAYENTVPEAERVFLADRLEEAGGSELSVKLRFARSLRGQLSAPSALTNCRYGTDERPDVYCSADIFIAQALSRPIEIRCDRPRARRWWPDGGSGRDATSPFSGASWRLPSGFEGPFRVHTGVLDCMTRRSRGLILDYAD